MTAKPNPFAGAARSRRKDDSGQAAPARGATAKRTTPVRITVDLAPEDYRAMRRLVAELADEADVPTLPHSRMWRAMLTEAASNPDLVATLVERIKEQA
jgi:hypothetical protein